MHHCQFLTNACQLRETRFASFSSYRGARQICMQACDFSRYSRKQRMCLDTFSRLRRSLAIFTLYAAVRILAERFLLYRKAISCKVKKRTDQWSILFQNFNAGSGTWTRTWLPTTDFESASSAIPTRRHLFGSVEPNKWKFIIFSNRLQVYFSGSFIFFKMSKQSNVAK